MCQRRYACPCSASNSMHACIHAFLHTTITTFTKVMSTFETLTKWRIDRDPPLPNSHVPSPNCWNHHCQDHAILAFLLLLLLLLPWIDNVHEKEWLVLLLFRAVDPGSLICERRTWLFVETKTTKYQERLG
jgi:hypothetical protein